MTRNTETTPGEHDERTASDDQRAAGTESQASNEQESTTALERRDYLRGIGAAGLAGGLGGLGLGAGATGSALAQESWEPRPTSESSSTEWATSRSSSRPTTARR